MSIVETVDLSEVVVIRLWLRVADENGPIPAHKRAWWYTLTFASGGHHDAPLPEAFKSDCECMADAVVLVAELHDIYIDRDHVANYWPRNVATWAKGN